MSQCLISSICPLLLLTFISSVLPSTAARVLAWGKLTQRQNCSRLMCCVQMAVCVSHPFSFLILFSYIFTGFLRCKSSCASWLGSFRSLCLQATLRKSDLLPRSCLPTRRGGNVPYYASNRFCNIIIIKALHLLKP